MSLIIGSSKQEMATEPLTNKPKGGDYAKLKSTTKPPNLISRLDYN
nr:MAG TPA: hypothetical protein [Bacteriophage sp.]